LRSHAGRLGGGGLKIKCARAGTPTSSAIIPKAPTAATIAAMLTVSRGLGAVTIGSWATRVAGAAPTPMVA